MPVGYRVFGFCSDCHKEMPERISHDHPPSFWGLAANLRRIVGEQGWTFEEPDTDYCPRCSKKRAGPAEKGK